MIKICYTDSTTQDVIPTIFPDGTSQVWKLDTSKNDKIGSILWEYEYERELIHLCQLMEYLNTLPDVNYFLVIPYLPYARQDKEVSNETTFSKKTFLSIIRTFYTKTIFTYDVHSETEKVTSVFFANKINNIVAKESIDFIVFPDAGANNRYKDLFDVPHITLNKVRNQLTGKIEDLDFQFGSEDVFNSVDNPKLLIVDDLSDYGGTFKKASKFLKAKRKCSVQLYVTHFLGHGDYQSYIDSGIERIYTSKSLDRYRKDTGHEILTVLE